MRRCSSVRCAAEISTLPLELLEVLACHCDAEALLALRCGSRQWQTSCTAAMQAACECVCDLHGMHHVEDDLRGALLMAAQFGGEEEAAADDETEDEAVVKLQEKSSTLKKFLSLMEEGLKAAAKEVPLLQDTIKNQLEFNYQYTGVADFLTTSIVSPEGRASTSHASWPISP